MEYRAMYGDREVIATKCGPNYPDLFDVQYVDPGPSGPTGYGDIHRDSLDFLGAVPE